MTLELKILKSTYIHNVILSKNEYINRPCRKAEFSFFPLIYLSKIFKDPTVESQVLRNEQQQKGDPLRKKKSIAKCKTA